MADWLKVRDKGGAVCFWKLDPVPGGGDFTIYVKGGSGGLRFPTGGPTQQVDTVHDPDLIGNEPVTIEHMGNDGSLPTKTYPAVKPD